MTQSGSRRTVEFRFEVDADTRGLELFQRELGRLDRATSIADSTLQAAGREVRSFLDTLQQSPRNITLARNALSALSNAATINSTAFRELRGSAAELTEALRNVQATARQVATQAISKVPDTANQQIRSLREGLRGLRADSQAYFNTLREIETRQAIIRANEGRARTWAAQAAFSSPTMTSGYGSEAQLQSFARTPAGYNQRISELQQQLANTSFGAPRQSIESEIQRLEGELTALINAGADARINQLAQSAITTRDRLLQVERQLEPLEQQIAARKRRMEELNREIRELGNPQAAALERQIRTRSARGEDVTDLLRQLDGLRPPELLRAQAELAELRAQSDSFVDQQLEIANRNAGRENVDASRMSYNELKRASSELRQELGGLEGQLSELASQYGRAARAADTYTASTRSAGTATGGTASQLLTGRRPERIVTPGEAYFRDQVIAPPATLALPAAGESYGSELRRREQRQRIQEKLYGAETPQQELTRLEATLRRLDSKEREYTNTLARIQLLREQIAANVPAPPTRLGPAQLSADQRGYLSFLDAQYGRGPGMALPAAGRTSFRGDYDEFGRGGGAKSFTYQPPSPAEQRAAESSARRAAKIAAQQEYYATGGRGAPPPGLGFGQYNPEAARRYQQSQQPPLAPTGGGNRLGTFFQSAGAISAGGFFGGVEGAVGGALGAAFGGPGAALGAASIGAQVGILRKALASTAELEAQLTKYQTSLKNVAGSQAEYERGLAAIESANRRLNIPLLEGTQSFTQLAAAVVGAGGKIKDAEIAYNAVNSAIKATGGSARDVEGAMLAITQVFSKGKVSAEEIRRQLGDRLPGAFTLFAESIGKSGPELDKLLREGKVGLNELMTFLVDLQKRYGGTAEQIAASSEDAGARLAVAWERARLEIGDALQPIGAEFQESLAKFLTENQEEIKQLALGLAGLAKGVATITVTFGPFALKLGLLLGTVKAGSAAIAAMRLGLVSLRTATTAGGVAITGTTGKISAMSGAMATARTAALGLLGVLSKIAKIGIITIGVDYVVSGTGNTLSTINELKELSERRKRGGAAAEFTGATRETVVAAQAQAKKTIEEIKKYRNSRNAVIDFLNPFGRLDRKEYELLLTRREADARAKLTLDPKRYKTEQEILGLQTPSKFPDPVEDDKDKETEKRLREQERIAAEQRRLAEASAQLQRRLARQVFEYQVELDQKRYENQKRLSELQLQNQINALPADQQAGARITDGLRQTLGELTERLREAVSGVRDAQQQLGAARQFEAAITSFEVLPRGERTSPAAAAPARSRQLSSQAQALVRAASKLGVSPLDLATIIGFETGGTYSPSKWGGAGGNYMGLIQFGPNERRAYGASPGQTFEQQVEGPVVKYFKDRFARVGMSTQGADLLTLYRTVLGGNPKASLGGRDAFGTSPRSGVAAMGPHRAEALRRFFGGSMEGITSGRSAGAAAVRAEISDMRAESGIEEAQLKANQAARIYEETWKSVNAEIVEHIKLLDRDVFGAIRGQTREEEKNLEVQKLRNRLLLEGAAPDVIDFEAGLLAKRQERDALEQGMRSRMAIAEERALAAFNSNDETSFLAEASEAEALRQQIEKLPGVYDELAVAMRNVFDEAQRLQEPTAQYQLLLRGIERSIKDLTDPIYQIGTAAESISGSFTQAFTSIITGSSSTREALANMFGSIANSFTQMAADILKEWVKLQVVKLLGSLLGGIASSGAASSTPFSTPGSASLSFDPSGFAGASSIPWTFARGGAFNASGITPFATGGIVKRPTFFRFAKGGTMAAGVMGEAGPEAIMPLKRGPDGKLGVVAQMDAAKARYRRPPGAAAGSSGDGAADGTGAATAGPIVVDVRYSVERINDVEYVTADQFRDGMRRAAEQGATQGEQRTLRRLQMSPGTRRKVGV